MGAKFSSCHDNRAPVANVEAGPASYPPAHRNNKPSAKYWSCLPESRAPSNNACAANPPVFAPGYNDFASNGHTIVPERRASSTAVTPPANKAENTNQVIAFHSPASWRAYFEASKTIDKLIVIDFTATWCGPCRYMEPTLNEFAAKYTDVEFVKIDVDELCNVTSEYGVTVMPTFLFIKKGKVIDRVIGARKEELKTKIEMHRA